MKPLRWLEPAGLAPAWRCRGWAHAVLLVAAILAWPPLRAAPPALPGAEDLATDAIAMRDADQPMVVLFSQRACGWCDRARAQLAPMAHEHSLQHGAIFRQIDIDRDTPLRDFSGHVTSHRHFSVTVGARFTPTLLVLGPDGSLLAEPILGMRLPDFYAHYVTQAIEQARTAMRLPRSEPTP